MQNQNLKTESTQVNGHRSNWIFYAVVWMAFTNLFFYAQDWFSIDPNRESRVLNNLYYASNGFLQVLVVLAAVKAGAWFSKWVIPLLIFYGFAFLVLLSFVFVENERWNLDMPWVTRVFFMVCGLCCVALTLKDFIDRYWDKIKDLIKRL